LFHPFMPSAFAVSGSGVGPPCAGVIRLRQVDGMAGSTLGGVRALQRPVVAGSAVAASTPSVPNPVGGSRFSASKVPSGH
jgi:hypothetical protein